jgi:hypothetical protein
VPGRGRVTAKITISEGLATRTAVTPRVCAYELLDAEQTAARYLSWFAAVIEDAAGRVLLCRQAGGHRCGVCRWQVRAAESPVHAIIRDVREETAWSRRSSSWSACTS